MSQHTRPVIGITVDCNDAEDRYSLYMNYATGVERGGGLPLLLPYAVDQALIRQYVDLCDGVLFTGGNDLDPALYGQPEWHPRAVKLDARRQNFELALIAEVERRRVPVLGVCLGSQLMNVHRGGSLIQFLPEHDRPGAIEHRRLPGQKPARHPVKIDPESRLGRAIAPGRSEISVNTYHKQGIGSLGRGLRVVATAPDGIIEAFEDPSLPLYAAVQWHPERLLDEAEHLALFRLLVDTARDNRR
ncbi:gamma-glutamyl-gamma-aminobutyrate hydrolase family protein [Fontivita pretiosa]|uniref:gamma-glutamyl-gamma-aminobutyrate hydrolase family protein n=1 Tax=Fontivita pretiosa TaxID=2989684 RepID=UPI003D179A0E